ncbi:chromate resistance protein [Lentibacter algarum]|uniref:chromate resistance protein ChrB domain-containing protein n=1 Tax=Lentibacter algarum TaxID=576131 RepID=UPI001C07ED99|nr:chromate resistance protein ChrB domain-containing protein [Lentibacter algarum]MBU2982236.1 chromate resistance protein [Lentibacter algarum]
MLNEITANQLMRLIGTPDAPVIVDVTIDEDFNADPFLIPTAFRHKHTELESLLPLLNGRKTIIICQKGKKLSQGTAAWLRAQGIDAENLTGGNFAWRDTANAPRTAQSVLPATGTAWVTRQRPKIDRLACPWLITRFVDPRASFLYVAPASVLDVAEKFGALSYDANGAAFSHEDSGCTFDTLLKHFTLSTPALEKMAEVIRAADLGKLADAPEAAGLLALSVGLSKQHSDDNQQLAAALPLYDALYRWARDGSGETHASQLGDTA